MKSIKKEKFIPSRYDKSKRFFDLLVSIVFLLLLSLVFFITALAIFIESTGPILYKQNRIGRHGKLFTLLKFRSMSNEQRDIALQVGSDTSGVTKVGRIIRRLKIDELPQLFNVFTGDLSLIGPRPCLPETLVEFGEHSTLRHSIRPGLSGLAQINGNIHLTWKERLVFDLEYVNNRGLWLDIKILMRTLLIVLFGDAWGKPK